MAIGWSLRAGTRAAKPAPGSGGRGRTSVAREDRAVEISDNFSQWGGCNTSVDDTGWGAAPPTFFCGGTGSTYTGGVLTGEMRQRTYHYSCRSDLSITMYRNRTVRCPITFKSRTSGGQLQCYKPAELSCAKVGNPVSAAERGEAADRGGLLVPECNRDRVRSSLQQRRVFSAVVTHGCRRAGSGDGAAH